MQTFTYTITDELGIHARPAGMLCKAAGKFPCKVTIGTAAKTVDAKRIMGVMGLCVKHGDTVTIACDGPQEAEAAGALEQFFKDTL